MPRHRVCLVAMGSAPRRQAARELGIGYATLKRFLDAWEQDNANTQMS